MLRLSSAQSLTASVVKNGLDQENISQSAMYLLPVQNIHTVKKGLKILCPTHLPVLILVTDRWSLINQELDDNEECNVKV